MSASVYFVPVLDTTWVEFGPMNPKKNYQVGIPPLRLCYEEAEASVAFMARVTGGKGVIAIHSGVYCREAFYHEPFLSLWESAVELGMELCLHTHEEVAGGMATLNGYPDHMKSVLRARFQDLAAHGLRPVAYRGGLYAYAPFLTGFLPELGIHIDLSAAPGYGEHWRESSWLGAPYSGYYLDAERRTQPAPPSAAGVFEIPIGADGRGGTNHHFLYVDFEPNGLDRLAQIWDACVARADEEGRPQWIHTLFHTISASRPDMLRRYEEFFEYCLRHGGQVTGAEEAKALYDQSVGLTPGAAHGAHGRADSRA